MNPQLTTHSGTCPRCYRWVPTTVQGRTEPHVFQPGIMCDGWGQIVLQKMER